MNVYGIINKNATSCVWDYVESGTGYRIRDAIVRQAESHPIQYLRFSLLSTINKQLPSVPTWLRLQIEQE